MSKRFRFAVLAAVCGLPAAALRAEEPARQPSVVVEVREESGLECDAVVLRGTISWPGFGKHGEDWFGFVFRVDRWSGTPLTENSEGTLEWVAVERILELPLWEGDRHFLPLVFERTPRQFHGVMPYRDGRPVRWHCSLI